MYYYISIIILNCIIILPSLTIVFTQEYEREYPPYDGYYNNIADPSWGTADSQLLRRLPNHYSDGVFEPSGKKRPNPMELSLSLMGGETGRPSSRNRTALLVFFGQQVVEEILDAQRPGCPPEYFNIKIPANHPVHDPDKVGVNEMPFIRSRYDMNTGKSPNHPRQQLNEITPFIDGGLFYGSTKAWADALRSFKDGKLAAVMEEGEEYPQINHIRLPMANPPPPSDHYLKPVKRFWKLGNPRGNENPFLLTFGVLWFRFHNYMAVQLKKQHGQWGDERLFNEARKMTIGVYQKIVFYDWLPSWLGIEIPPYGGYKPTVHPGIAHVFQSAAMRFGHTLVPPGIFVRNASTLNGSCLFEPLTYAHGSSGGGNGGEKSHAAQLRTCNTYWNAQDFVRQYKIDSILRGMASQITEKEDNIITPDLRGFVFGTLDFSRRDLMAINIQRGRDHGLPDYNTAREELNLARIERFVDINPTLFAETPGLLENLTRLYKGKLDDIDVWVGGILETTERGPGQLFRTIIKDQFERIRDGDRFWYENYRLNKLYSQDEIDMINDYTLKKVILATTKIRADDIQDNPFFALSNDTTFKCPQPMQLAASFLAECTPWKTFDYFKSGEIAFITTFLGLVSFVLLCCLMFLVCVQVRKCVIEREEKRQNNEDNEKRISHDGFMRKNTIILQPSHDIYSVTFRCTEWMGKSSGGGSKNHRRPVRVMINAANQEIEIRKPMGNIIYRRLNYAYLLSNEETKIIIKSNGRCERKNFCLNLILPKESYNLVMLFDIYDDLMYALVKLKKNFKEFNKNIQIVEEEVSLKNILKSAKTKEMREKELVRFFNALSDKLSESSASSPSSTSNRFSSQSNNNNNNNNNNIELQSDTATADILNIVLSRTEFADYFQLKETSLFVKHFYTLLDDNKDGFISFNELLQLFIDYTNGNEDDKLDIMFKIYSKGGDQLKMQDFRIILKSQFEGGDQREIDERIEDLIKMAFTDGDNGVINCSKFKLLMGRQIQSGFYENAGEEEEKKDDGASKVTTSIISSSSSSGGVGGGGGARSTKSITSRRKSLRDKSSKMFQKLSTSQKRTSIFEQTTDVNRNNNNNKRKTLDESNYVVDDTTIVTKRNIPTTNFQLRVHGILRYFETYRWHIACIVLYDLITLGIFLERAYYYSVEREHGGLRRIAGYGVTVTRGAASAMMFTYSTILLTMCRNIITKARETFLDRFIPFDSSVDFHKHIAYIALLFTIIHCVGHGINFYHISTQPPFDVTCLFRNYFRSTHELATFTYWCWQTITGLTGILAVILVVIIFVFSTGRRRFFKSFYYTHHLYIPLFIAIILHGTGRLVQPPIFHTYFLPCATIFVFDKLISIQRRKIELSVMNAECLPSQVTRICFKKPIGFQYKSGQWVRVACLSIGKNEYHPFTLTSAPHEENLSLHVRAVGPWTKRLRSTYKKAMEMEAEAEENLLSSAAVYPNLFLDGPYGEGHQDWYNYKVCVLIGGGIGVTPFVSILKDLVEKSRSNRKITTQKVYFLWVTRTQNQFEWMLDIIADLEKTDNNLIDVNIFITQFRHKFDIRTNMLYICENHFQKIAGKSLFAGVSAKTHFGRPNFHGLFQTINEKYNCDKIGVFSCGPVPMTRSVENACKKILHGNRFIHHYENF